MLVVGPWFLDSFGDANTTLQTITMQVWESMKSQLRDHFTNHFTTSLPSIQILTITFHFSSSLFAFTDQPRLLSV